jgi:hypothetical protein
MKRELRNIALDQHVPSLIAFGFAIIVCPVIGVLAGQGAWALFERKSYLRATYLLGVAVFSLHFTVACGRKCHRTWRSLKAEKFEPLRAPRRNL